MIYNYFTYDDVKELIEDGVIRVNNDLKDMLKKGEKRPTNFEKSQLKFQLIVVFCFVLL